MNAIIEPFQPRSEHCSIAFSINKVGVGDSTEGLRTYTDRPRAFASWLSRATDLLCHEKTVEAKALFGSRTGPRTRGRAVSLRKSMRVDC